MASTRLFQIAAASALSGLVLLACDDNPVAGSRDDPAGIVVNPDFAVVDAGDQTDVDAFVRSRTGEPTRDPVSFTACDDKITVAQDQDRVRVEPPDRAVVTGVILGQSCVIASGAGRADTAVVDVVPAGLLVVSAPDTLRAGQSGEVVVTTVAEDSTEVGPFTRMDVTYASDDTAIARVTSDRGDFTTRVSGPAAITTTWEGSGTTRQVTHGVLVLANVPTSAAFDTTTFGAVHVDSTTTMEVVVTDAEGNPNTDPDEVLGATVQSSDPSVAQPSVELVEDTLTGAVNVIVTVAGNASGSADISGEVQTSEGNFAFDAAPVTFVAPSITTIVPGSGGVGADVVISGADLAAAGFDTEVLVGGASATEFVSDSSATQVVLEMPNAGSAGDHDVVVLVGGVASEPATWSQTADADASEPNDDAASAEAIVLPFSDVRSFQGEDVDDFYSFTLPVDGSITVDLDWNVDAKDLDILITDDAGDLNFDCLAGATGDKPEHLECDLPAGSHRLWINDFTADGALVSYEVSIQ